MAIVAGAMIAALALRGDTELHVLRDRAPLYVTLSDGTIRNGYTLKILNKAREPRRYVLTTEGVPGAVLSVVGAPSSSAAPQAELAARPDSVATYRVFVAAPKTGQESLSMTMRLAGPVRGASATHTTSFVSPRK